MLFSTLFFAVICSRYASGVEVKVAVGDEAVFRPTKPLPSPTNSIAWKHISNNVVIAIEWDEDGFNTPNNRFKDITTLNEKTGVMKIKPVDFNHIGEYFYEVNSKEQGERFKLTVANRVQKPEITKEPTDDPDVVYLRCEYSETIIWSNSTGEPLKGSPITPKGESITVRKNGDPETFYTCSLRNDVSEETSDPIYEKDLFKYVSGGLSSGAIAGIIIVIIAIIIICVVVFLYKRKQIQNYQPAPNNDKDETKAQKDTSTETNTNDETNNPGKENQVGVEMKKTGPRGNDAKPNDDPEELKEVLTVTNTNDEASENTSTATNANGPRGNDANTIDETNNPGKENQVGVEMKKTDETNNPGKENQVGVEIKKTDDSTLAAND